MEENTTIEVPEKDYVLAEESSRDGDEQNDKSNQLRGHRCCGGCCDMRRATMIVNYISIAFTLVGLLQLFSEAWYTNYATDERGGVYVVVDDDLVQPYVDVNFGLSVGLFLLRLVCNSLGLVGAYRFSIPLVSLSLMAYVTEIIFALFLRRNLFSLFMAQYLTYPRDPMLGGLVGMHLNVVVMAVAASFAYPQAVFIYEVRKGIMSPETCALRPQQRYYKCDVCCIVRKPKCTDPECRCKWDEEYCKEASMISS